MKLRFASSTLAFPCVLIGLAAAASAQIEHGGAPPSARLALRASVATRVLPLVDNAALLAEDELATKEGPLRFAAVLPVDLGPSNSGTWEKLPSGDRVWRLRISSRRAHSILLSFERFQLPLGAELFVANDDRSVTRGAYTYLNHLEDGRFAIQPIPGDAVTLEYFEPAGVSFPGELRLNSVLHDYRGVVTKGGNVGNSGSCNVDVACPEGVGWEDQVRSVALVMAMNGTLCSGFLVNNTLKDGTPFLLSAEHCGNLTTAVYLFNWKRSVCGSGVPTAMNDSIAGATLLLKDPVLDFQLMRLSSQPPTNYGVFLAGWDRSGTVPTNTTTLHHPKGDVMKISLDNNPPLTPTTQWRIVRWEVGVTEPGSSGCPLFDPNHRAIGQLRAGAAVCGNPIDDFYTRMDAQWSLIAPFLDPIGTGQNTLNGLDPATLTPTFTVIGIQPTQVEPLIPGTDRTVKIFGSGITPGVQVDFDGAPLAPANYGWFSNSLVDIDMPQAAIGKHTFTVKEGGQSLDVDIDVVAAQLPIHQAGNGNPGNRVNTNIGVDLINADTVGHTNVSLWSLSNIPSVHPLATLSLGNQFTQIMRANLVTIPPSGYIMTHVPLMNLGGMTVYSQSFCPRCPILPHPNQIEVSNLQETFVVF